MARLMATANGNNTDAATWAVIDSTSFNESETSQITPTTAYTGISWATFTPGAITVDGIGIRIGTRSGTTGTLSVELYNSTDAVSQAGTEVTVNMSDVVDATVANLDGGWMFFKFSSPVTLTAAKAYQLRVKTSSSSQIIIFGSSSTSNCRILRTTTTQAPVAGDDRFVMGEWTAAATMTTRSVTLNDTGAAVDYGSASTSTVTPALSVSAGGTVLGGTTATTTYVQKISGHVVVYNGGILRLATSGSRMPTDSSFSWTFDCVSNIDFGITINRKGEFTAYGETKQRWTTLTADVAASATVIPVSSTSGWKNGDTVCFAGTGTTTTHGETKTISTVDSSTQITLTGGLTNAHTGTGDMVGEVGNLSSNIKLLGTSTTVGLYVTYKEGSISVLDNIEIQYYGSGNSGKRGVESQHVSGGINSSIFTKCAFRDMTNSSALVGNLQSGAGSNYTITNNILFNASLTGTGVSVQAVSSSPIYDVSTNLIINCTTGMSIGSYTDVSGTITNNNISGCTTGLTITSTSTQAAVTNISGFKIHSNTTGLTVTGSANKTITSFDFVCNASAITTLTGFCTFESCNFYGNSSGAYAPTASAFAEVTFNSCNFRGRTSFAQPAAYIATATYSGPRTLTFNSCNMGQTTAHSTADISISGSIPGKVILNYCNLASSTEITSSVYANIVDQGYIGIQRKDTTANAHTVYIKQGIVTVDTSLYRTASPSMRITPKSASITCSNVLFSFKAPVNSGQTCTPTVYVRESETGDGSVYNGNRAKLYVRANHNLGITSDTLLDTATAASDGAWEGLTGTTSAVTDNGVLEFYVVVDGTAGWVNLDDFTYINA